MSSSNSVLMESSLPICPICLEECKIPVEMECFSCFQKDSIHCHSLLRYCEQCCIRLFELDKPVAERKNYVKCLYCDAHTDPRLFHTEHLPYRRDYYVMAHDRYQPHKCPYCEKESVPTHQDLFKHVTDSCVSVFRPCGECRCFYQGGSYHMTCPCSEYIVCTECHKMIQTSINQHLTEECIYRKVTCRYCQTPITAIEFTDHLLSHIESSKQRTTLLQDLLEKEDHLRRRMLHDCHIFYRSVYAEDDI